MLFNDILPIQMGLYVAANLMLVALGLYLTGFTRALSGVERHLLERLEVALHLVSGAHWHQLQRPDENLAEVPDDHWVGGFVHRTGSQAEVAAV